MFSLTTVLITLLYKRLLTLKEQADEREKADEKRSKALENAMVAMMRDRIFQACRYHMNNGFITTGDLEVLNAMYESYHDLGGDQIATELVHRVNKLDIKVDPIH